jgi:hypothetical protein
MCYDKINDGLCRRVYASPLTPGYLQSAKHGSDPIDAVKKIHLDTWTVLSSFNHPLKRARGERGMINGSPTPGKWEAEPGQISAQWTGVGEPFIIPRSPRARPLDVDQIVSG